MLYQLSISDYAIVDQLDLSLTNGMTVITGETGAGKSIMLDALGLVVGDRADSDCLRPGASRAEIRACFDLEHCLAAQQWLKDRDLDEGAECILRRVITGSGRSRGYINGSPSTLTDLKAVGELLVDIHSQHGHQSLLKKSNHRLLLDDFAGTSELASQVADIVARYGRKQAALDNLFSREQEQLERMQLLSYQLQELEQLDLNEGDVEQLEQEHRQLTNATAILRACHQVTNICVDNEGGNVLQQLALCVNRLSELNTEHPAFIQSVDMLSSAQIQVEEAVGEINHFVDCFDADPQRLQVVEERLSAVYELARKHRVQPDGLLTKYQLLSDELEKIQCQEELAVSLKEDLEGLLTEFNEVAQKLS